MSNRHPFLRKITDSMKELFCNRLIKSPKYMAVGAYALSFIVFVFYFENTSAIIPNTHSYQVAAAGYETDMVVKEETCLTKLQNNLIDFKDQFVTPPAQETLSQETIILMSEETKDAKETISALEKTANDTSQPVKETISERTAVLPAGLILKHNQSMVKTLSDKELEVLHRIVEAEATGEDIYGKILVANVVLNRVNAKEFPDTITEVVFQKTGKTCQFSPISDGRYWSVNVSDSTMEAVSRALAGEDYSNGALFFFARRLTSNSKAKWFDTKLEKVVKYGGHEFYTCK